MGESEPRTLRVSSNGLWCGCSECVSQNLLQDPPPPELWCRLIYYVNTKRTADIETSPDKEEGHKLGDENVT